MVDKCLCGTETEIVFQNNNFSCCDNSCCDNSYGLDPINIFNAAGKHVGYSWNYGDSVELSLWVENTVLKVSPDRLEELKMYLSGKEIEFNFINIRGEVVYTFYSPADLITKLKLNDKEDNLIDRNTYTLTCVLINPKDLSRINLLLKPYKVFVK